MTDSLILETLAREAKSSVDNVRAVFDMLDAGLSVPFIGRFRRDRTRGLPEAHIRRLRQRREELVELDRRRVTVLKAMEKDGADKAALDAVRKMTDRFELEDQYLPYRRPEPEVQLALDRGLGALADELVKSMPKPPKADKSPAGDGADSAKKEEAPEVKADEVKGDEPKAEAPEAEEAKVEEPKAEAPKAEEAEAVAPKVEEPKVEEPKVEEPQAEEPQAEEPQAEEPKTEEPKAEEPKAEAVTAPDAEPAAQETPTATKSLNAPKPAAKVAVALQPLTPELAILCARYVVPDKGVHSEEEALAGARRILADRLARNTSLRAHVRDMVRKHGILRARPLVDENRAGRHKSLLKLKTSLRQLQGYKLIALRQAQKERVLSTVITLESKHAMKRVRAALGKYTRPEFEGLLREIGEQCFQRRLLPTVEADVRLELKERGDREALRFLTQHLRAVLMAPVHGPLPMVGVDVSARGDWTVAVLDRNGEVERVGRIDVQEKVALETEQVAPAAEAPAAEAPAAEAPAVETPAAETPAAETPAVETPAVETPAVETPAAEAPAVETPAVETPAVETPAVETPAVETPAAETPAAETPAAETPAAPEAVTATVAAAAPVSEARAKPAAAPKPKFKSVPKSDQVLGKELAELVGDNNPRALVIAGQRTLRRHLPKLRLAAKSGGIEVPVLVTNDAGLSSYANSDRARKELSGHSVPERTAISLARRAQDPLAELLKLDPWQLSLGPEQSLVSKANLRRALSEMVESTAALVGCRLNSATESVLTALPGLDAAAVQRIMTRRAEKPFKSREELRTEEVLTEAQWASAIAFLRVPESEDPLDCTSLHPEQYPLVRRMLESVGTTVKESLGRPGVSKGLKRSTFEVDEGTWRDLIRELSFPGRDARMRNRLPELLDPQTDMIRLAPGRVVEGVITSVAGFGAFVDVGLEREAMLHVSQLGRRYVRDAREDLSVGQTVRAVIKESSEKRLTLSMSDVPPPERAPRNGGGGGRSGGGGGRGQGKGDRPDRAPRVQLRPGDARGMPLGDPTGKRKRPTGGPGSRDAGPLDREPRGERVNLKEINAQANQAASHPFAKFFKGPGEEADSGAPDKVAASKPARKKKAKHENVKWTPNAAAEEAEAAEAAAAEAKGAPSPDAPEISGESSSAEGNASTEGSAEEKS